MKRFFSHLPAWVEASACGNLARQRQHQGDGVLGGGDRIAERRVHHDDALGGRRRNVDVVDADAGAADHLEVLRLLQDLRRDLGGRADREAVELADQRGELLLVVAEIGLEVDLDAAILEDLDGGGRQGIGDEHARSHGIARPNTLMGKIAPPRPAAPEHHAAFGSASLALAKAQSSHGVSASTSRASTVAPHQMRRPGGASR